jgi:hypothetical protein
MKVVTKTSAVFGAFLITSVTAAAALQLSELRSDQPGFPDDEEFVEIQGDPGESLDDVWFLYIGDHSGEGSFKGSGTIERALDLSGNTIPDDGHFLMVGPGFDGEAFGIGVDQVDYVNGVFGNALENSDNVTALLVRGFTEGEIVEFEDQLGEAAVDIDDNDDGVPNDTLPWTEVIDAIGKVESTDSGEFYYGEALGFEDIGPNGNFVPAHVWRAGDTGEWQMGEYELFEEDDDGNVIGINPEAFDTPGTVNPNAPAPEFPPMIETVGAVFAAPESSVDLTGQNFDTVTSVTVGELEVPFAVDGTTLTIDLPAGAESGIVTVTNPDGEDSTTGSIVIVDPEMLFWMETFDGDLGEFSAFSVSSDADWTPDSFNDATFAEINGFGADEASDDWLVSSAVDLTSVTDPFLMIGHERAFSGPALEVLISTDYDGSSLPTTATWTPLEITTAGDGAFALVDSGKFDLSAYEGETVYIAFHYTSVGTDSGEAATDRVHYVAFGGESLGWDEDPQLGWLYYYTPDWATSYTFGLVNTANFPWIYQVNFGYMYHVITSPEVAAWLYNSELGYIYVGFANGGWFEAQNNGWEGDNFINPVD